MDDTHHDQQQRKSLIILIKGGFAPHEMKGVDYRVRALGEVPRPRPRQRGQVRSRCLVNFFHDARLFFHKHIPLVGVLFLYEVLFFIFKEMNIIHVE